MKKFYSLPLLSLLALSLAACGGSSDDTTPEPTPTPKPTPVDPTDPNKPTTENIPDYADDYSGIAGWADHLKWNLANVHDPSVAYYQGKYYMYGTDASYGNAHVGHGHFQGKVSSDLVNWKWIPGIWNDQTRPKWIAERLNEFRKKMGVPEIPADQIVYDYWAPVVRTVNVGGQEKLRMYYSVVIENYIKTGKHNTEAFDGSWTERAFIGMAETTDPEHGKWEDKGFVTCSSSDKGATGFSRPSTSDWNGYFYYNAIDPTYIVTPEGDHYLIHGSWHSGFAILKLDPATGKPDHELGDPWDTTVSGLTARYGQRIGARANNRWQASEAPEVVYKDGYYYLFMAYDGLDVPYNTRVVRSKSITGPYTDITGRDFTAGQADNSFPIVTHPYRFKGHSGWVGISHCCVFQQQGNGDWFYMSQGRLPANTNGNQYSNAIMMGHVRRIVWCPADASTPNDLWPIALPERYAGLKDQSKVTRAELVGKWEHIKLEYKYGQQDASVDVTLNEDGTIGGKMGGKWSFDEAKQWLTLGNVVVVVAREADWEAKPRCATIVYAGTQKSLNATYWGKKVK